MTLEGLPILLCTNGRETNRPALEYGVRLAGLFGNPVVLLGVVEYVDQEEQVKSLVEETRTSLAAAGVPNQVEFDQGRGSLVIAQHAQRQRYLTVAGPLGRPPLRRFVQGRSFRRLLEKIPTPLLYVPAMRWPVRKILLCMGGLEYSVAVEHLCLSLARRTGAEVTLFHAVEPVTLDYPVARQVQAHWQDLLKTDTPQGHNLRMAKADLEAAGLKVVFKVCQGAAVHAILSEVHSGDYDLIAMGSPYSAHSLRHLYLPNVTAEVAETAGLPVLTAR